MYGRPNALAADLHSYLLLTNCTPLEAQDPDDTFLYSARVCNSQYQLHTSPIEHNISKVLKITYCTYITFVVFFVEKRAIFFRFFN